MQPTEQSPPADHGWSSQLAVGRQLSALESDPASLRHYVLRAYSGSAGHRIGITGSPGVGKSTLIASWLRRLAASAAQTAIVAIDPTSAVSGGAVLGDRYRFSAGANESVFIRSIASRGSLGGASPLAASSVALLEEAGFGSILIETVGLGQVGEDVRALADTVVVLLSPESGDGLQMLKAGPLETGDIFVVNKSDRPGADALVAEVRDALHSARQPSPANWNPLVVPVSALLDEGIDVLIDAVKQHQVWIQSTPAVSRAELRFSAALRAMLDLEMAIGPSSHLHLPRILNGFEQQVFEDFSAQVYGVLVDLGRRLQHNFSTLP